MLSQSSGLWPKEAIPEIPSRRSSGTTHAGTDRRTSSRDGSHRSASCGAPQAVQVVDRFHLVQHLGDTLERFFLRYRRDLTTLGTVLHRSSEPTPTPAMISQARHARWVRRYHRIQPRHAQRLGIAAIARRIQVSRPTVSWYLAMPQRPSGNGHAIAGSL